MLTHLDLFSGIGGFALACQWAGIETIGFVEIDKYCQKVLRKHWSDVPIVEDIRDVEKIKTIADSRCFGQEKCQEQTAGIKQHSEIKEIVANTQEAKCQQPGATRTRWAGFTNSSGDGQGSNHRESKPPAILITAGFPCQPFSVAGKRAGEGDDRYLWPETLAVIEAIKPKWVLLENVTGIINLALDTVLSDLEGAGYAGEMLVIPACAVNAWHRRDRVWIVANLISKGLEKREKQDLLEQCEAIKRGSFTTNSRSPESGGLSGKQRQENTEIGHSDWWAVEPELGRVAHGIPNRVDRLKCLGNAIVPQVAYEILRIIAEIENDTVKRCTEISGGF